MKVRRAHAAIPELNRLPGDGTFTVKTVCSISCRSRHKRMPAAPARNAVFIYRKNMYLKSIEVQGFKSFANKITFEFQQGITGIVGPNGSGKSNVADAVRWVLGEQSAKSLRAGGMQDVIFAGTETRKPQSFASVAITFDNSDRRLDVDYEEVTVTRRLYRSGESEYLLNKAPVRLKDINDIFYDTGIGKEGYSIIGQGQVERILNGKPEERRELFDEAAGIVRFKRRKAAALKKLDREHQDLTRVNDILREVERQIGPAKAQAEKAQVYLDTREKLKRLDTRLFVIEEARDGKLLDSVTEKQKIADSDIDAAKAEFSRTRAEYDRVEGEIGAMETRAASLADEIKAQEILREQLSGQISVLTEQIRSIENEKTQNAARREEIAGEIEKRKEARAAAEKAAADFREKRKETEDRTRTLAKQLEEITAKLEETAEAIRKANTDVIGVIRDRTQVKAQIQRYDTMLEQMGIRASEIDGRMVRLKEQEELAQTEDEKCTARMQELNKKLTELKGRQGDSLDAAENLEKEITGLQRSLEEKMQTYNRTSSRLHTLRAMTEHYDGYSNGIKKIMERRSENPGIRGVVADLINVPEKYETAIETALGGSIRNIVTDNDETAKYLISYLKASRLGRCTFLPLTSIRGRQLANRSVLQEKGVIGVAAELVGTEPAYEELKKYLLGRIVVVDNIDDAIRIGRKTGHSVYMVTLAGESFAPGGSITGGSFKNSENLLGRRREIAELDRSAKKLKKESLALSEKMEAQREKLTASRETAASLGNDAQKVQLDLNSCQMAASAAVEQLRVARVNLKSLRDERGKIASQMEEIRGKRGETAKTLETSVASEQDISGQGEKLREEEERMKNGQADISAALEKLKLDAASLTSRIHFEEETAERLAEETRSLAEQAKAMTRGAAGRDGEAEEKRKEITEKEKALKAAGAAAASAEKAREDLLAKKQKLSDSHKVFFQKREELSARINDLERELIRLNAQQERLEEGSETRAAYLWDEYNMTPSEARAAARDAQEGDRGQIKKEISSLKSQIRGLGNVNVNAIEEYKELSGRYDFLHSQHEDLVKSEDTLNGIIKELDSGMRRQFNEKFAEIRAEFDRTFSELFGGGHGTLEIEPDVDILEAPIHIIAHPPGKKLQNMMQLSGGEKSLTAIALLFAIQRLKPSPFCLLDEIEAALDESNVVRFADYLHKLTAETQFIIITHRRGTMNQCDRLYGITMQEKGVSAMVAVNLIEDKLSK